jgi:pyridoxamine 5'-phosphate oxidase
MNPIQQIVDDRTQARISSDPNADLSFLATADDKGKPYVRTLVLREITDNRFTLYLNSMSPKWQHLTANGEFQLLLFYPTVLRQYRLNGDMRILDSATVGENWKNRPPGSKYLDHYYKENIQGSVLDSREQLTSAISELKRKHSDPDQLTAPAHAMGIELVISSIDRLDLSMPENLHDRRLYQLSNDEWSEQVLVP